MPHFMSRALYALLLLSFVSVGCGSGGMDEDEDDGGMVVVNPTFNVSSINVPLANGLDGIQFFLQPSENVTITEVRVTNPVGGTERFNGNNNVALSGQPFALQNNDQAYTRVSGNWSFEINGAKTTGSRDGFTVTETLSVSALQETTSSDD